MKKLVRRRSFSEDNQIQCFNKYFNLPYLIFFAITSTIGSGIFFLTGTASSLYSGQYTSVCYFLAALRCLLSALSFAEFSARVKAAGSTYSFFYYSLGELIAFIAGWCILIGIVVGAAVTSLAWSTYLDAMLDNVIKNYTSNNLGLSWTTISPFSSYIDLPALGILTVMFIFSFFGVQCIGIISNVLAVLKIILLILIIVCGFIYGNPKNLTKVKYENGVDGIIKGTSLVQFAYYGFEGVTRTIAESKDAAKIVPLAMLLSIVIICFLYSFTALSLNFMVSTDLVDINAPFAYAFADQPWVQFVIALGPVICLTGNVLVCFYGFSRITYAIADDGLLFKFLAKIHPRFKIPHWSSLLCFVLSAASIIGLNMQELIGFSNVSSFFFNALLSCGLIVIRFYSNQAQIHPIGHTDQPSKTNEKIESRKFWTKYNKPRNKMVIAYIFIILISNVLITFLYYFRENYRLIVACVFVSWNILMSIVLIVFFKENIDTKEVAFKIRFVSVISVSNIAVNIFLMMANDLESWIGFGIICLSALPIYFFYGIRHSKAVKKPPQTELQVVSK